jgi:hypothetical protein
MPPTFHHFLFSINEQNTATYYHTTEYAGVISPPRHCHSQSRWLEGYTTAAIIAILPPSSLHAIAAFHYAEYTHVASYQPPSLRAATPMATAITPNNTARHYHRRPATEEDINRVSVSNGCATTGH